MPFPEFIAGSISGAVGLAVGYPLDTIKVRLQVQSAYKGIFDCVSKTYTHEGARGFFKGMTFPLLTTGIISSVAFGSYVNVLNSLTQGKPASVSQVYTAGFCAGLIQTGVCVPIELVKVRLQAQITPGRYHGPFHCVTAILKEEGLRGMFRGGLSIALRDAPAAGVFFVSYEMTRKSLTETFKQPETFSILMAGGVAGVVTWVVATPMDVMKARLQMSGAGGREYSGLIHCMTSSVREEGVRVFFKGLQLNSVRAFPVNAITFLCFESLMKLFNSPR